MCTVAPSPVRLQCSGSRLLSAPFKVSTRLCHLVSATDFHQVGGRLRAVQGPTARVDNQGQTQSRRLQQCRAQADEGELFDFNLTNNAESFTSEDKETFLQRLVRAWSILFPTKPKPSSNAEIAKQRLKMILISDRCSVNDAAKRKIVNNIVDALSDFVEIESEEKVQLNVTSDPDLGTVYSVTVPVRRVRPEYQEFSKELVNTELRTFDYEEEEGNFRMVDIRFEHPDVQEKQQD